VGVHRIHALAHPGLSFLVVTDGSLYAQAAVTLGGQIARLSHARVTLLGCGAKVETLEAHLQEARKNLGSGLAAVEVLNLPMPIAQAVTHAVERKPFDLVILGFQFSEDLPLVEGILQSGEHHLLLVPAPQPSAPINAVISVTSGEPGKDDVLFAGRLIRHLNADATLLTVLPGSHQDPNLRPRTERFINGGIQTLALLGVPAAGKIREGNTVEEIIAEVKAGDHDLLVLGTPLMKSTGKISLDGVVGEVLSQVTDRAILVVRSHLQGRQTIPLTGWRA